jgi:hypothetical protein
MAVEKSGEVKSLFAGANLAFELGMSNHTIGALRLLRFIAISKQHHGREHELTKDLERKLFECKTAHVGLRGYGIQIFEVLRYEEYKYVVRGPKKVAEERMQTLKVDEADVTILQFVTPVVCHGLKNKAEYLNGKIGDIRSIDKTTGRYGVFFEDGSIKPKSVKPRNLRIIFELPDN